ncbi:MAG: hypothetical protein ABEI76_09445 [Halobacteriales archaeon]
MTHNESIDAIEPEAQDPWERTISEAERLAADREAEGWEAVVILVGHTSVLTPNAGTTDQFGLVHTIPKADAATLEDLMTAGSFPEYHVFSRQLGERTFQVTGLIAPDRAVTVLLVSSYLHTNLEAIRETTMTAETMYTHVRTLDGAQEFIFEHDNPGLFFA